MRTIFWNEGDQRLRAIWRVLIVSTAFVVVSWLTNQLGENAPTIMARETIRVAANFVRLLALVVLLFLSARFVDKRPFSAYGLNLTHGYWWLDFGIGGVISAAMIIFIVFAAKWFGWAAVDQNLGHGQNYILIVSLTRPFLGFLAQVMIMEWFFRGFLITNLGEGFNFANGYLDPLVERMGSFDIGIGKRRINRAVVQNLNGKLGGGSAWVFSSLIYSLSRIGDVTPNMTLLSDILKASILLGLAFILTRQLGMSVGMNLGWNFVRSHIFGLHARGLIITETSLFFVILSGPEQFTGGEQGIEGSLLAVIALGIGGVLVTLWVQYRSRRIERDFDPWVFEYRRVGE